MDRYLANTIDELCRLQARVVMLDRKIEQLGHQGHFDNAIIYGNHELQPLTETLPPPMGVYQNINTRARIRVGFHCNRPTMPDPALVGDPVLLGPFYVFEWNGRIPFDHGHSVNHDASTSYRILPSSIEWCTKGKMYGA